MSGHDGSAVRVRDVHFKKAPGSLELSRNIVRWLPADPSAAIISLPNSSIKGSGITALSEIFHLTNLNIAQAVNVVSDPATSKVILKLTQTGNPADINYNFHFAGTDAIKDRERVKELLVTVIGRNLLQAGNTGSPGIGTPKGGRLAEPSKGNERKQSTITFEDIKVRQALLAKNKDLARLHRELVIGGVVSEDDFWQSRSEMLATQQWQAFQKRGTSSASLADLKPTQGDGSGSDVKYTLTPEIIHSFFVQYPSLHTAYQKNVPDKLSETEFWTKVLASRYFHRSRSQGPPVDVDDFFKEYIQEDDDVPKRRPRDPNNVLLDLSATTEDHLAFGNEPDSTMRPGAVRESLPLIRRYNRHSTVIVKSSQ
ncbi:hypothetical protein DFJ73DRAFT_622504 [Zopfochytrium polystomum]|nr:hypothetical protein DFJ73DRAFT_622504 [Zopfochytrium polystomum]